MKTDIRVSIFILTFLTMYSSGCKDDLKIETYPLSSEIPAPGKFSIMPPGELAIAQTLTVVWTDSAHAISYKITLDDDSECTTPEHQYEIDRSPLKPASSISEGTYFICAFAQNAAGVIQAADNNGEVTQTIDTSPPASFSVIGPDPYTALTTPTIAWQMALGASSYEVKIADEAGCSSPLLTTYVSSATFWTLDQSLTDGTYAVCVAALDAAGNRREATNGSLQFSVDTVAPQSFSLTTPVGTVALAMPTIGWTAAAGASDYSLRIDDNSDCSTPILAVDGISANAFPLTSPLMDSTYYLCVEARDLAGNSTAAANSSSFSFTIDTTPPADFSLSGPASPGNDNTPTISWSAAAGASSYNVQVDNNSDCSSPVYSGTALTGAAVTLGSALADGSYYVCASAYDAHGNRKDALNSGVFTLVVDIVPPAVFTVTGPSGSTSDTTPRITWAASTGAVSYDVTVDDSSDCASPVYTTSATVTSQSVTPALADNTYYICVSARDAAGNTRGATNNAAVSFTVASEAVAPTVSNFTVDAAKLSDTQDLRKTWSLSWAMNDNVTPSADLEWKLYKTESFPWVASPATIAGNEVTSGYTVNTVGNSPTTVTVSGLKGPAGIKTNVNYLLVVSDLSGNTVSSKRLSVRSDNRVTLSSIKRSQGKDSGNQLVVLRGTGFTSSTANGLGASSTVTIGGIACSIVGIHHSTLLLCRTGNATGTGLENTALDVVVTNPSLLGTATLASAFTYQTSPSHDCDDATKLALPFASGDGLAVGTPKVICTAAQLASADNAAGTVYYKLGDNIDLQGAVPTSNYIRLTDDELDGDGFTIHSFHKSVATGSDSLFNTNENSVIKNLAMTDCMMTNMTSGGGCLSYEDGGTFTNIFIQGQISASARAGLLGRQFHSRSNFSQITLVGSVTTSSGSAGALAGSLGSFDPVTISNVRVYASQIVGAHGVGGLLGSFACSAPTTADCVVEDVVVHGKISRLTGGSSMLGGLIGRSEKVTLRDSAFIGEVEGGGNYTAGLVASTAGNFEATIVRSYCLGKVHNSFDGSQISGLLAHIEGPTAISNSFNVCDVTLGVNWSVAAGISVETFGAGSLSLGKVFNAGDVVNVGNSEAVGLVGVSSGSLDTTYASGLVNSVTSMNSEALSMNAITVNNSFWDREATTQVTSVGSPAADGRTTTEMQNQATYSGWNFTPATGDWVMPPSGFILKNDTEYKYPIHRWYYECRLAGTCL